MSDIIDTEPVPAGGGVNKPSSGTYGEKAAVARLQQQLPAVERPVGPGGAGGQGPVTPPGPGPRPGPPPSGGGGGQSPIPGIPAPIFAPTNRPTTPVNAPLAEPGQAPGVATPSQAQLRILDALKMHEDPEVAEWAGMVFDYLVDQTRNE